MFMWWYAHACYWRSYVIFAAPNVLYRFYFQQISWKLWNLNSKIYLFLKIHGIAIFFMKCYVVIRQFLNILTHIYIYTLIFLVNSLTCYQCIPETSIKCTETKVECAVGQCGTMKTTSYMGKASSSLQNLKCAYKTFLGTESYGLCV